MAPIQRPLREMALFAGAGGGILGGILLGWETICAVEINAFCARRLMQRQNEGHLPPFPIWDDVSTFDGQPWRGRVDVVSGGFPCQGISSANHSPLGLEDSRSGLWREMARIVGEVEPSVLLVENSPRLTIRGLWRVIGDLSSLGYNARWGVLSAAAVGAEHPRERIWILGYSNRHGESDRAEHDETSGLPLLSSDPDRSQCERGELSSGIATKYSAARYPRWGKDKPGVDRMADGMAAQLDRLRAIGNGQVPAVAKLAWETLTGA